MRELPVARAVADREDVGDVRATLRVGTDPRPPVERDASRLEPEAVHERRAPGRDEHEVALDHLVAVERDAQPAARVLDPIAARLEVHRDAALPELLQELGTCLLVLLRDEGRQHLDDRHLRAEPVRRSTRTRSR